MTTNISGIMVYHTMGISREMLSKDLFFILFVCIYLAI